MSGYKDLPAMYAAPIETLVAGVRRAATSGLENATLWDTAARSADPMPTGYTLADATTAASRYGAHLVRLEHGGDAEPPPWWDALRDHGPELNSTDVDARTVIALDLRRQISRHPGGLDNDAGRDVAKVYAVDGGSDLAVCTAHLARRVNDRIATYAPHLEAAWYSTHGPDLLHLLAAADVVTGQSGRPPAEAAEVRALQRRAARGMWATGLLGKSDLAEQLRISRPTLDAWLAGHDRGPAPSRSGRRR